MSQWLVSLAILGLLVEPQAQNFTDQLWEENLDIYREILDHSFLTGLSAVSYTHLTLPTTRNV